MKFKVDENLPQEAVELLTNAGYDARSIYDQNMVGETDPNIAKVCQTEDRIIGTLDTDFGDIRVYPPSEYPGIIVLRLKQLDKPHVLAVMKRMITSLASQSIAQRPQFFTQTAYIIKLLLRLELSGVPGGSTRFQDKDFVHSLRRHLRGIFIEETGNRSVGRCFIE